MKQQRRLTPQKMEYEPHGAVAAVYRFVKIIYIHTYIDSPSDGDFLPLPNKDHEYLLFSCNVLRNI